MATPLLHWLHITAPGRACRSIAELPRTIESAHGLKLVLASAYAALNKPDQAAGLLRKAVCAVEECASPQHNAAAASLPELLVRRDGVRAYQKCGASG